MPKGAEANVPPQFLQTAILYRRFGLIGSSLPSLWCSITFFLRLLISFGLPFLGLEKEKKEVRGASAPSAPPFYPFP